MMIDVCMPGALSWFGVSEALVFAIIVYQLLLLFDRLWNNIWYIKK